MRIALFSDIHANLPALKSFFQDVETRDVDAIYCLGDLVGYNVWPNEVIDEIRRRMIPVIAGNYDFGIGRKSNDCGCAYRTEEEKANGAISIALTNDLITDENREYLRTLPHHLRIEFRLQTGDILSILLVHGSPRRINEYLFEGRPEKSLHRIMKESGADVLCFGHTHLPYHRILSQEEEGEKKILHAINTGSVGKPKDGDPRGNYVILEVKRSPSPKDGKGVSVEFIKFSYDIEKAAGAIEVSPLPDAYAQNLRNGK